MTWIEALVLGIIQGLTEFLPVSSSGHLEIGSVLLGVESTENLLFAIVVHLATAIATLVVFWKDIQVIIGDLLKFRWNESTQFVCKLLLSMVPVFVVGIFFKDQIEQLFVGNLSLVGSMLLVTSALLFFAHYKKDGNKSISNVAAIIIGVAQSLAILPGISRSGATISTALILGVERSKAARFSFLMVLLPIIGASILQIKTYVEEPSLHQIGSLQLIIGFLAAFLSGFIACKWMLRIVKKGKLTIFAGYCLLVGIIAVISSL
ncbi:MAG: undecaprenyl-diphosphate phosphatase [Bacteroidota bacterium]